MLDTAKLKVETVHLTEQGYAVVVGAETPFPKVRAEFTVSLTRQRYKQKVKREKTIYEIRKEASSEVLRFCKRLVESLTAQERDSNVTA